MDYCWLNLWKTSRLLDPSGATKCFSFAFHSYAFFYLNHLPMKSNYALILVALLMLLTACEKDKFEGCCDTESQEITVGSARLFIPNIFTPNGDGLNDTFFPFSNSGVELIEKLEIKNWKGDLLYIVENLKPNDFSKAWNGNKKGDNAYEGLFKYTIAVRSTDQITATFSGIACSYFCSKKAKGLGDLNGCRFGTQHDGNGFFCEGCTSLENNINDCF